MARVIELDERLKSIADMICMTGGGGETVVADIGSDHAYLPVWLYMNGKIKKAFACDISVNSIEKIKRNTAKYNIPADVVVPVLSNGLSAFETAENLYNSREITHIVIAGMGGNNIAEIISGSMLARQNILVLQANSKVEFLREFLYKNGFSIMDESISVDRERLYVSLCVKYYNGLKVSDGDRDIDLLDIIIGRYIISKKPCGYRKYVSKQIERLRNILTDLEKKDIEGRKEINTDYGSYKDIENLIVRMENL